MSCRFFIIWLRATPLKERNILKGAHLVQFGEKVRIINANCEWRLAYPNTLYINTISRARPAIQIAKCSSRLSLFEFALSSVELRRR